ncbi:hypothetical protein BpHYR1_043831 [Brachionus plicatilis]|uniref:Uncharacterized protein n=1 Tax=Brachionus plicatilis TaxID=10195 RepID=A0A3M7RX00_BRAPC|nr:hypothetical protein BpHYR1_043831 [Brachionus plicatilis]
MLYGKSNYKFFFNDISLISSDITYFEHTVPKWPTLWPSMPAEMADMAEHSDRLGRPRWPNNLADLAD